MLNNCVPSHIPETTRRMNRAELRVLSSELGLASPGMRFVRASILTATVLGLGAFLFEAYFSDHTPDLQVALLWFCFAVGVVVAVIADQCVERRPATAMARQEYNEGLARVLRLRVVAAVQAEEVEDNGAAFYLQVEGGGVFFLVAQDLYGPVEERTFPSTEIEVALSARSGIVVSVKSLGKYLAPLGSPTRIPMRSEEDLLEDGRFVDVSFDDLVPRLRREPQTS